MTHYALVGIIAGLVSALLFASAATGSALALFLFYTAPLPLYVAGFGWGSFAALLAVATGGLSAMLIGGLPGLIYAASVAAPAFWLTRLVLLSRPLDDADPQGPREFYPIGRIVIWAACIGPLLASATMLALGPDAESAYGRLRDMLNVMLEQTGDALIPDEADRESVVDTMARIVPSASAGLWMLATLMNIWLAGRIVLMSGRAPRPWPPVAEMQVPRLVSIAFLAAILLAFMPGMIGLVAGTFASTFSLVYILLGLAILHVVTRPMAARPFLLGAVYMALVVLSWTGILVAAIGLSEPLHRWREKTLARMQGGGPPAPT